MRRVLIAVLWFAGACHAQVLQVSAGAGNLDAAGGQVTAYVGPTTQGSVSVGFVNGHLVEGLNAKFNWKGWGWNAGDQQLFFSTGQLGVAAPLRGVSIERHNKVSSLSLFVGLTGNSVSLPFAFGSSAANKPTAGIRYARKWGAFESSTVAAFTRKSTALEEIRYHWQDVKIASTVGLLNNAFYWDSTATFSHDGFSGVLAHQNYIYEGVATAFNTAGAGASFNNGLSGFANVFQSSMGNGASISADYRHGFLEGSIGDYRAEGQSLVRVTVIERVHRLTVSQYITHTNKTTVSFGVLWQGNIVTAGVSQQLYFMPATGKFEQALGVNVALQLPHSTSAVIQTNMLPTGKEQWLVYGSQFDGVGALQIEGVGHETYSTGKFAMVGTVVDNEGHAVQGVAVTIAGTTIYSNGAGEVLLHEKKDGGRPMSVDLAASLTPGNWEVVSCPDTAIPSTPFRIVVRRKL